MPPAGQRTAMLEATGLCLRFGAVDALKAVSLPSGFFVN